MSVIESVAPADESIDGGKQTEIGTAVSRHPRRGRIIGWSTIALGAILLSGWLLAAAAETHDIVITGDARPLVCAQGQDVTQKIDGYYTPLARLTPALDCNLRIHIYNDGVLPVHLDAATFNLLGSQGVTARVDFIDGLSAHDVKGSDAFGDSQDGIDSVGSFQDGDLQPGESFTLVAHITASKLTCYAQGSSVSWVGNSPVIDVTALGVAVPRQPTGLRFGFAGTAQSTTDAGCAG